MIDDGMLVMGRSSDADEFNDDVMITCDVCALMIQHSIAFSEVITT